MAISDTITSMYENVGNVYDVLELAGADLTNVDKNIENLKQSWEERLLYFLANGTDVIWNNWLPKVTGSGETITLNNTIEAKMNIVYKGNTSQKTTTGKNLFNSIYYKNKEIYTETISIVSGDLYCAKLYLKPNTTYTISEALNNWTLTGAWIFAIADTNNQIIRYLQTGAKDYQTNPTTFTTNSEGYVYIGHRYGFTNGGADRAIAFLNTVNIQIEEGNTATSFEEYTNGASPNPDYPQDIQVVSGDNTIKVEGKNLFDASIQEGTFKDTTYTVASDGKITQSSSDDSGWGALSRQFTLKSGTYTISLTNKPSTSYIQLRNITDGNDLVVTTNDSATFTINDTKIVAFKTYSISGTYPISYYVQIEKGSTSTTFQPYQSQSYPINIGNIELCKIGDYQDKIAKSTGKNLFDVSTITENTYIDENGTTGSSQVSNLSDYIEVKSNTSYTLSYDYLTLLNSTKRNFVYYDENKTYISGGEYFPINKTNTFTTPNNTKYIRFSYDKNCNSIMLNEGTTALPYEPYGKVWYLNKQIGKAVLNGSENITSNPNGTNSFFIPIPNSLAKNDTLLMISNGFKGIKYNDRSIGGNNTIYAENIVDKATIRNTTFTTLELFTTWLGTHNTVVYYVLNTPTYTEITDNTLISQLEAIKKSYNTQTNISQTNDDKSFILDVVALGELEI